MLEFQHPYDSPMHIYTVLQIVSTGNITFLWIKRIFKCYFSI